MLIRKSFATFLVLQSEASRSSDAGEIEASRDYVLDWRWFAEEAAMPIPAASGARQASGRES